MAIETKAVGKTFPPTTYAVGREKIKEYALDTNLNPEAQRLVLQGMNLEGREIVEMLGSKLTGGQVGTDTDFNGIRILSGSVAAAASAVTLQVGANNAQTIAFTIATVHLQATTKASVGNALWSELPTVIKEALIGANLQSLSESVNGAALQGGFDRPEWLG